MSEGAMLDRNIVSDFNNNNMSTQETGFLSPQHESDMH